MPVGRLSYFQRPWRDGFSKIIRSRLIGLLDFNRSRYFSRSLFIATHAKSARSRRVLNRCRQSALLNVFVLARHTFHLHPSPSCLTIHHHRSNSTLYIPSTPMLGLVGRRQGSILAAVYVFQSLPSSACEPSLMLLLGFEPVNRLPSSLSFCLRLLQPQSDFPRLRAIF